MSPTDLAFRTGVVLELGRGTSAVAAVREGFPFIGCEMEAEYRPLLEGHIRHPEATCAGQQLSAPPATVARHDGPPVPHEPHTWDAMAVPGAYPAARWGAP